MKNTERNTSQLLRLLVYIRTQQVVIVDSKLQNQSTFVVPEKSEIPPTYAIVLCCMATTLLERGYIRLLMKQRLIRS